MSSDYSSNMSSAFHDEENTSPITSERKYINAIDVNNEEQRLIIKEKVQKWARKKEEREMRLWEEESL